MLNTINFASVSGVLSVTSGSNPPKYFWGQTASFAQTNDGSGFLIFVGGTSFTVSLTNLRVNGQAASTMSEAQTLLSALFQSTNSSTGGSGTYLPLTGGTLTGGLTIYSANPQLEILGANNTRKSIDLARYDNNTASHYIGDDGGNFFGNGLGLSSSGANSQMFLQPISTGRNVNIGSTVALGAKLGVKGDASGNPSLDIQDSSGVSKLKVSNAGVTTLDALTIGGVILITAGSNKNTDDITLVAGTKTVNNTRITASSKVFLTCKTPGGVQGFLSLGAIVAATSFIINSSNVADTSIVSYLIIN